MTKKSIVVAVTGGVAAFKCAAMVSRLVQDGYEVRVVMTQSATKFVGSSTFRALTGQSVVTDLYDDSFSLGAHIEIARESDLLCVAPATANFLGKAAGGIADDLVSTLYLCFAGPVLVAPAMNVEMWNHVAVQRNLAQLKEDGVKFVDPQEGWLSCRTKGVGRMAEPETITAAIADTLK